MADLRTIDAIVEEEGITIIRLRENNVHYVVEDEMGSDLMLGYQVRIVTSATVEVILDGRRRKARLVESMKVYTGDSSFAYNRPQSLLN